MKPQERAVYDDIHAKYKKDIDYFDSKFDNNLIEKMRVLNYNQMSTVDKQDYITDMEGERSKEYEQMSRYFRDDNIARKSVGYYDRFGDRERSVYDQLNEQFGDER